MRTLQVNEYELIDAYPVHVGYLYVADGSVVRAQYTTTAAEFKKAQNVKSLTNCDMFGRGIQGFAI